NRNGIGEGDVMRDIMMDVYNALIDDEFISSNVQLIKFYEYTKPGSIDDHYNVMDEIDGELPMEYADNTPMAASELIQVDVYVRHRSDINARIMCKKLDNRIKEIIWGNLGMYNTSNSKPEYDVDFKLYRRASRFEGAFYYEKILGVIE